MPRDHRQALRRRGIAPAMARCGPAHGSDLGCTSGWWSVRWGACTVSAGCGCVTSGVRTSTRHSSPWCVPSSISGACHLFVRGSYKWQAFRHSPWLQLCRPLSEAVISGACHPAGAVCGLQLCRPLSEAVIPHRRLRRTPNRRLQLCRPLSEAVMRAITGVDYGDLIASIVPPPFGSGYTQVVLGGFQAGPASIVPPPFGSGYSWKPTPASSGA